MNAQVDTVMDDPITLTIAERALEVAKLRSRWNAVKDFYLPIVNALNKVGVEPRFTTNFDIQFSGDAHKLAAVVRILRTSGFTSLSAKPKEGDTTWSAFYRHPACAIEVWLYFTSTVCQRVKVGTRLVEQDIYETRCGEIPDLDALPLQPSDPALDAPL